MPKVIDALLEGVWLASEALFVIETGHKEILSCPLISIEHEKIYGDSKITLASLKADPHK